MLKWPIEVPLTIVSEDESFVGGAAGKIIFTQLMQQVGQTFQWLSMASNLLTNGLPFKVNIHMGINKYPIIVSAPSGITN